MCRKIGKRLPLHARDIVVLQMGCNLILIDAYMKGLYLNSIFNLEDVAAAHFVQSFSKYLLAEYRCPSTLIPYFATISSTQTLPLCFAEAAAVEVANFLLFSLMLYFPRNQKAWSLDSYFYTSFEIWKLISHWICLWHEKEPNLMTESSLHQLERIHGKMQ